MTVSINFPTEVENALRSRAAAAGQDVESFVQRVIAESLLQDSEAPPPKRASAAEFAKRLDSWIALHPVLGHAIDDSRESLYAGRE
jgi:plasmid stability protein